MIPLFDCGDGEEIFEYLHEGRRQFYNVTRMRAYAEENPDKVERVTADVVQSQVKFILENRGIEERKLARLREPWLSQPILAVVLVNGQTLIVDGHHRYVRAYMDGKKTIEAVLVPWEAAERFLIDVPEGAGLVSV